MVLSPFPVVDVEGHGEMRGWTRGPQLTLVFVDPVLNLSISLGPLFWNSLRLQTDRRRETTTVTTVTFGETVPL